MRRVYLDFGAAGTTTPTTSGVAWNNMTQFTDGRSSPSLLDSDGVDTLVTFSVGNQTFSGGTGLETTGPGASVGTYPATAVQDGMRIDTGVPGIELKVNNLGGLYAQGYTTVTLRFWGSTSDTTTMHRVTIGASGFTPSSASYDAAANASYGTAAVFTDTLGPTSSATLLLSVPAVDTYSVLSVLEIVFN